MERVFRHYQYRVDIVASKEFISTCISGDAVVIGGVGESRRVVIVDRHKLRLWEIGYRGGVAGCMDVGVTQQSESHIRSPTSSARPSANVTGRFDAIECRTANANSTARTP